MTRKLIAFDIDGTLFNSLGQILPSTLEAIKILKEKGHLVTLATGRSYTFAKEIIENYHFENYLLTNGAVGFLNHQLVLEKRMDKTELVALDTWCQKNNILAIYQSPKETYRNEERISKEIEMAMASFHQPIPPFKEKFLKENHINQAIAFYNESFDSLAAQENFQTFDLVRWHPFGVDILPKGNSKAKGLLKMAEITGINEKDTIAFGDGLNDREMLKEVGLGIAMGNAKEEVKTCSDMVTDTNDNDGIYKALQQLKLI